MIRALVLTLLLAVAAVPAQAADQVPPITYQSRTLANGLRVLTSHDATTPNVTVQVWYGVGSKDDPVGRSGFAHLFEHMMFKATTDFPAESIDRFTEDVGGLNNASTYDDFTNYYEVVPANHLQRLIWVEAKRLSGLVVDEANFKSERDVVKEELRQRVLADPYGRLFALYMPRASYTTHPYKRPGIGSIEELDAATLDDVQAFHQAYYRPDNATLIVVGNFDEAQLQAWVDQYFGPMKAPASPIVRVSTVEPPRVGPGVFTGYGPNVPLPAVALTWLAPAASSPDAPALDVLDAVLSSGKSSRLYNGLVYSRQVAADIFSDADLPQQPGMIYAGAIMASGHDVAEGEAALLAEIKRLRDTPVTPAELSEAKNELIAGKLRERETLEGRAFALGYALATEGDPAGANGALAKLQAVSAEDVRRVAMKYLDPDRRMTIRYLAETERPRNEVAEVVQPLTVASVAYSGPVSQLAPPDRREPPPLLAAPLTATLPTPVSRTLKNGLKVIVAKSSDLPLVTADLTLRVGSYADPTGKSGLVSMTAGMLTEGTRSRSAQQIAAEAEALGASLSSGGGQDSASVTLNVMPGNLAKAMSLMADVARNPAFRTADLKRQISQALDGLSVAYQQPGQLAGQAVAPVVFAGTGFGHVADGTPATLKRLAPADLARVHQTYFRPDNAVLVLTGDITPRAGLALAQQVFGGWTAPRSPRPIPLRVAPRAPARTVVIDLPGTGQAAVSLAKASISRSDPGYYPGLVANAVLGGGYSARLNQEIRIKRGLSYGAGSSLTAQATTGLFRARVQTKNESARQVLDLARTEVAKLSSSLAGPDELAARQSSLIGAFGRNLATTDGLADILGNLALYEVPLSELKAYPGKVNAVTAGEVQAFARSHLNPASLSVIVVGDAKVFLADLKAEVPGLEVIPATKLDLESPTLRKAK